MHPGSGQHPIGISRRELLQVGFSGLIGMGLPSLLSDRQRSAAFGSALQPRATSVILIFLTGGPSHIDTFDMKPTAADNFRGEFRPIATRAPGVEFCEHLPQLAQVADKLAIVRSMTHGVRDHFPATHFVLTGHNAVPTGVDPSANLSRLDWPCYAAGLDANARRSNGVPSGVTLPHPLVEQQLNWPGQHAGFLGAQHDPWQLNYNAKDDAFRVPGLRLPDGITVERLDDRRALLSQFNQQRAELERLAQSRGMTSQQDQAFQMLTSGAIAKAFSIASEPDPTRDLYGRHKFGQSLLLARRLVEAGVPIVQANMGMAQTWDTHTDNFLRLREELLPPLDRAVGALVGDLAGRGMLDQTMIVMLGEFGRTPKMGEVFTNGGNASGRDHWGNSFFAVFAGGGVRGGQVIGRTDKIAAYPVTRPYYPADIGATIYSALGVDLATEIHDPLGRPLRLNQGHVIEPLLAGSGE